MSGLVSRYVEDRIERQLRECRVVLWYDPEEAFSAVFESMELPFGSKLPFEGSYFALRQKAEEAAAGFHTGDSSGGCLLVYVPDEPLASESDVLYPLECLGTRFTRTLREEASTALRDLVPSAKAREWLAVDGISLEKLDELVSRDTDIGSLSVVFGEVTPSGVAWEFLRNRDGRRVAEVEAHKQLVPLQDLLTSEYGVRFPKGISDVAELRDGFAERVLLYEFLDDLDEVPPDLEHYELPARETQLAACRELARRLRDSQALADEYLRWANDAQKRFRLTGVQYDAATLGSQDTFPFEERLALGRVHSLAQRDDWEAARDWIAARRDSFWVRHSEERRAEWRVAELAVALWLEASSRCDELPRSQGAGEWVEWYAAEGKGGWRSDQLARKLGALRTTWVDQVDLGEVVMRALNRAAELERVAAERFVDDVAAQPETLEVGLPQLEVFKERVLPSLAQGRKTALVLADALRFEMAEELAEMLESSGELSLDCALATLPTLTKIGMAALGPGSEDGLDLEEEGSRVVASVGGRRLPDLAARRDQYAAALGDRVSEVTLDNCLGARFEKLQKLVDQADLLLVLSQDLDEIGETDRVYRTANLMSQVLSNLHGALRRLANAGIEEFIVVADHGYLMRNDVSDAMKLDIPSGDVVVEHRRCVIGRNLGRGDHFVVLRCAEIGLGGDLELAFPRGVNVFRVSGGNLAYLHGGLSLQECVIPVLRYVPAAAQETGGKARLEVTVVGGKVTNRYFPVMLSYQASDLFDQDKSRRFRLELVSDGDVVGRPLGATEGYREAGNEIELRSGQESAVTIGITGELDGQGELELRVFDAQLGETVKKTKVPYELAF